MASRTMSRPRVARSRGQTSSARSVRLDGPELSLHGYWADPERDAIVRMPVLDHGYYPRLDHPPTVVRQHVTKRQVTVPSESALRANGYDVGRIIFVSEVVVHPRHEKNLNFFRTDLPAIMRSLARREGITFLLPASDNPSAKLKRKAVLAILRASFTPLLMRGRQYTSGRVGFFVVPHSPRVTAGLRRALHLEGRLDEYTVGAVAASSRRPPRPHRRDYPAIRRRRARARDVEDVAGGIADELDDRLLPLVRHRLHLMPSTKRRVEAAIQGPEAGRALATERRRAGSARRAASRWVETWLLPKLKTQAPLGSLAWTSVERSVPELTAAAEGALQSASGARGREGRMGATARAESRVHETLEKWHPEEVLVLRQLVQVSSSVPGRAGHAVSYDVEMWQRWASGPRRAELGRFVDRSVMDGLVDRLDARLRRAVRSGEA